MNKKQKAISLSMLALLVLSVGGAFAQNVDIISGQNKYTVVEAMQIGENFKAQYQHQYDNRSNVDILVDEDKLILQVKTQRRFMFWDVETLEEYELNENGEVISHQYNLWSRLLNRNKVNFE